MDPKLSQTKLCQSCGMPITKPDDLGTNADGNHSREYCKYCYAGGKFTADISLDNFIEKQVEIAKNMLKIPENTARAMAHSIIPKLKRWNSGK